MDNTRQHRGKFARDSSTHTSAIIQRHDDFNPNIIIQNTDLMCNTGTHARPDDRRFERSHLTALTAQNLFISKIKPPAPKLLTSTAASAAVAALSRFRMSAPVAELQP